MRPLILICLTWFLSACDSSAPNPSPPVVEAPKVTRPLIRLGLPQANLPPYFIDRGNRGIERDILYAAFARTPYQVDMSYLRKREAVYEQQDHLDCISTVRPSDGLSGFYSDAVIAYQDVLFHLASADFEIKTISDLADKSIEAFHGARDYLGLESVLSDNGQYHEHSSKASQIVLLYRRQIQVLIMDYYFFLYFRQKVTDLVDTSQPLVEDRFFKARPYSIVCKDEQVRDAFNQGLQALKADGTWDEIIVAYQKEFHANMEKK